MSNFSSAVNRKLTTTEVQPTELVYYEAYNRKTGEAKEIVRLGEPTTHYVSYKKSWWPFSKYVTKETEVVEIDKISDIHPNLRANIAEAGTVEREEAYEEQQRLEAKKNAKAAKKRAKAEKRHAKLEKKLNKKAKKDQKRLKISDEELNADANAGSEDVPATEV